MLGTGVQGYSHFEAFQLVLPKLSEIVIYDVDPNAVQAQSRDGVLHISIKRRETAQPRRISVH